MEEELYDPRLTEQQQEEEETKSYTLRELLDSCDYSQPVTEEERVWLDAPLIGAELDVFNEPYYTEKEWEEYEKWADKVSDIDLEE